MKSWHDEEPQPETSTIPSINDECDANVNQDLQHMANTSICKDSCTKDQDEDSTIGKHLSLNHVC